MRLSSLLNKRLTILLIAVMCFCLLCACGNSGSDGADSISGSETDDSYNVNITGDDTDDISTDSCDDEYVWELNDSGCFEFDSNKITYSFPDGLYFSFKNSDDWYQCDCYWNEDMSYSYLVSVNQNIIYDEIDDYKRKVYSDIHDRYSKSSKVSYEDYVVDGRDVTFISISYTDEYDDSICVHREIYAATILENGNAFEVIFDNTHTYFEFLDESVENFELDFELVRGFFENIEESEN